jgi:hypothetical protein
MLSSIAMVLADAVVHCDGAGGCCRPLRWCWRMLPSIAMVLADAVVHCPFIFKTHCLLRMELAVELLSS